MHSAYEFTFAGEPSSSYGLFVCDLGSKKHSDNSFGNVANIVETRLPERITPLHFGVRYHDDPLEFTLIFAAEEPMDRYELQAVAKWLTGHQNYQWMTIDQPDLGNVMFHCLIESLTPVSVGWFPVAFEAKVICDCPYGYSYPFSTDISVSGSTSYIFHNDSTINDMLRPDVKIALASSCRDFTIANNTTGTTMQFTGLPAGGITILADNENEILTESTNTYDIYDYFNFKFLEFTSGDNELTITGTGTVTISGRFLYNVGA